MSILGFFSRKLGLQYKLSSELGPPHPQASVPMHPPVVREGGGHIHLRERGWEGPNLDEGTSTVLQADRRVDVKITQNTVLVLYVHKYRHLDIYTSKTL
jgi:hypothetical protein